MLLLHYEFLSFQVPADTNSVSNIFGSNSSDILSSNVTEVISSNGTRILIERLDVTFDLEDQDDDQDDDDDDQDDDADDVDGKRRRKKCELETQIFWWIAAIGSFYRHRKRNHGMVVQTTHPTPAKQPYPFVAIHCSEVVDQQIAPPTYPLIVPRVAI